MNTAFVDRRQGRRNFSRVAPNSGAAAFLGREIAPNGIVDRKEQRLDYVRIDPACLVDLGCARGASLPGLTARYPGARQIAVDLAPEMLASLAPKTAVWERWLPFRKPEGVLAIAADGQCLPLKTGSAGLLWSNLLLHWLDDPLLALAEAHRVLEVGGLLMFSTLGPDTFRELRSVFGDGYSHTQRFADMHDIGDMLVETGFADPVMDMEVLTLTYDRFDVLLAELRSAGAACAMRSRNHGLTGKGVWQRARDAYDALRRDGKLPATIEVVYGHAWKTQPSKAADGRSVIRFEPPLKRGGKS